MDKNELSKLARVRPDGTIVMHDEILCDGADPHGFEVGKNITCYSHIHDDHIKGLDDRLGAPDSRVYSTEDTKKLASALFQFDSEWINERTNYEGREFGKAHAKTVETNSKSFEISFLQSHHILGSAQILVRGNKNSVLYSSDFLLKGTVEHVEKNVDCLILDATHGEHSERQDFDEPKDARIKVIKKVKEEVEKARDNGDPPRMNVQAHRGTIQLVMSWIREHVDLDTRFVTNRKDMNVARIYSDMGHECGVVEDEDYKIDKFFRNQSFIHFLPFMSMKPECEIIDPLPSFRVGSTSNTDVENPEGMYRINLKEHATVPEVMEYVRECNPKHVVIDNSSRTKPNNAVYLSHKIKDLGFNVSLSPESNPGLH